MSQQIFTDPIELFATVINGQYSYRGLIDNFDIDTVLGSASFDIKTSTGAARAIFDHEQFHNFCRIINNIDQELVQAGRQTKKE